MYTRTDWWITKNVSGRLLVGLRWWNENDEEGNTHWKFETLDPDAGERAVDAKDSFVFWTALYVAAIAWALFSIIALLKLSLDYLLICTIAIALVVSNIIGYVRCSKGTHMTGINPHTYSPSPRPPDASNTLMLLCMSLLTAITQHIQRLARTCHPSRSRRQRRP